MTPLRIDAAYERILYGTEPAGVRWGFRAVYDSGADTEPAGDRRTASAAPRVDRARGPRGGPREADPGVGDVRPDPDVLRYSARGRAVPLVPAGGRGAGRGVRLDVFA